MLTRIRFISILSFIAILLMGQVERADASYQVTLQPAFTWFGTTASRTAVATSTYKYTYGDEVSVVFGLPWPFTFYGQTYSQITADTNGNIWFGDKGILYAYHSFSPATTNGNPVIATWNDDLSSHFYGGVYVQRLTNPDCVVVEWNTETYSDEGYRLPNRIEAVLFPDGKIRLDYNEFKATRQSYAPGGYLGRSFVSNGAGSFVALPGTSAQSQVGKSYSIEALPINVTVNFEGYGGGSVTSIPAGIACNTDCTHSFPYSTAIKLQATPDQYSNFAGWSGGVCSGTGDCTFTLNSDTTVSPLFNSLASWVNFSASPTLGGAPHLVNFTDLSPNATSWSWDFGDGTVSTLQNPSHVYSDPGTYTVTLTATNANGTNLLQKINYITASTCQNQPVRIARAVPLYYPTLQQAYAAAVDGDTIQIHSKTITEGLTITKSITIDGGYDCGYSNKIGKTTFTGNQFTINSGTTFMKDLIVNP